ncbi:MAG TPA: hypothetical protein ENK63_04870 [Rhodobacterales bacterium]|nr:hypothetical protein [Rhodobacterales bacterium]
MGLFIGAIAVVVSLWALPGVSPWLNGVLSLFILTVVLADIRLRAERDRGEITSILTRARRHSPYRRIMRRLMARLRRAIRPQTVQDHPAPAKWWRNPDWYLTPRVATRAQAAASARSPFSWRVLDFAVLVAFAYPIFLAALEWAVTSQSIGLGHTQFFPAEPRLWPRALLTMAIALFVVPRILGIMVPPSLKGAIKQFSSWAD